MKRAAALAFAFLLTPLAVFAGETAVVNSTEPVDQIYFDATISKEGRPVTQPHALVRVGSTAQLSLGPKSTTGPRLGLRYVVPPAGDTNTPVTVAGLIDGREVVSGPIEVGGVAGRDSAGVTLDGGGYTWRVHALRMSAETIRRRQLPRR
ncbi:MAG TPA: hypothetical protein VGF45_06860 [Polyangia bacterium]